MNNTILQANIELVRPNPQQPRKVFDQADLQSLADSIRQYGVIEPLIAVENLENGRLVSWTLIAGERRLQAAKLAGLKHVPLAVRESVSESDTLELALIENIQRADLTAIEEARGYRALAEHHNLSIDQISERTGKHRSTIHNKIRLLHLPESVQEKILSRAISERQGIALLQMYELPADLLKSAEHGNHKPSIVLVQVEAGASSDYVRQEVRDIVSFHAKRIIWPPTSVFAIPPERPAKCADCPAMLYRQGESLCGDESCFHVRLNAHNRQTFSVASTEPKPEPKPDPRPASIPEPDESDEPEPDETPEAPEPDELPEPETGPAQDATDAMQQARAAIGGALATGGEKPTYNTSDAWKKATVTLTFTLMPDDGDPNGRPIMIGLRANNGVPAMIMTREANVNLSGYILDRLNELKEKI